MKLLYAPASPFARKVVVCACEWGLIDRFELVRVNLTPVTGDSRVDDVNPLGKIPTLVLSDGSALFDSRVIIAFLHAQAGRGDLAADGPEMRAQALTDGLLDAAILVRYETALRPANLRWPEWIEGQWRKIERSLAALEASSPPLTGELSLAQICTACALAYLDFRFADRGWRDRYPRLALFQAGAEERASLSLTRPTLETWR